MILKPNTRALTYYFFCRCSEKTRERRRDRRLEAELELELALALAPRRRWSLLAPPAQRERENYRCFRLRRIINYPDWRNGSYRTLETEESDVWVVRRKVPFNWLADDRLVSTVPNSVLCFSMLLVSSVVNEETACFTRNVQTLINNCSLLLGALTLDRIKNILQ